MPLPRPETTPPVTKMYFAMEYHPFRKQKKRDFGAQDTCETPMSLNAMSLRPSGQNVNLSGGSFADFSCGNARQKLE